MSVVNVISQVAGNPDCISQSCHQVLSQCQDGWQNCQSSVQQHCQSTWQNCQQNCQQGWDKVHVIVQQHCQPVVQHCAKVIKHCVKVTSWHAPKGPKAPVSWGNA